VKHPPETALPQPPDRLVYASLVFAALATLGAFGSTVIVRHALEQLSVYAWGWEIAFVVAIVATACLFIPAMRAYMELRGMHAALAGGNVVDARINAAAGRDHAWLTFGWGAFALIILGFACFVLMNNAAVGRTFFFLPLIEDRWRLVTQQFFINNIFIFITAEILVLVWGLIVALARLIPGPAGRPIRAIAILYCDVFRGLPAIVTLYLVGFGIPTSGLPDLIVPHIVGLFVDLSGMSVGEVRTLTRIPVTWWCVLALTLTYGAYVAEVYRAGIESIHWSQVSAARSLGLSYMQTMRYVVVPQAVRRIVAPLLNDFIGLQKDTALVQVVGVVDAFNQSRIIAANAFNLSAVTIVAILFVVITIPQARFVDKMIERDNARMRAGG
jgi:polar amino acid transport system permease protein